MSIAAPPLDQEPASRDSSRDEIDHAVTELRSAMPAWAEMPLAQRIQIAQACLDGVVREAREWVMAACRAKSISFDSPLAAEEIANGPLATVRYLRLLIGTL